MCTHGTHSIGRARIYGDAGVDAAAISTNLLVPTFGVGCTAWLWCRRDLAIDICIPDISWDTHANHRPLGQSVVHGALSIPAARVQLSARVPADFLQTRLPARTVTIHPALRLDLRDGETSDIVGISLVVGNALTASSVTAHNAVCIDRAVTGIYAFLIPASQYLWALVVHHTLRVVTQCVWIASPAIWTVAPGPVIPRLAQCSHSTLCQAAGVHTVPVDALIGERALQVTVTAG